MRAVHFVAGRIPNKHVEETEDLAGRKSFGDSESSHITAVEVNVAISTAQLISTIHASRTTVANGTRAQLPQSRTFIIQYEEGTLRALVAVGSVGVKVNNTVTQGDFGFKTCSPSPRNLDICSIHLVPTKRTLLRPTTSDVINRSVRIYNFGIAVLTVIVRYSYSGGGRRS